MMVWQYLLFQAGIALLLSPANANNPKSSSSTLSHPFYSNTSTSATSLIVSSSSVATTSTTTSSLPSPSLSPSTSQLSVSSSSNISTISRSLTSTVKANSTSTVSVPASITSCAPPNLFAFFDNQFSSLGSKAIESMTLSEIIKLKEWYRTLARVAAAAPYTNSAHVEEYLLSLSSTLMADVTSLFGPAGLAVLTFQSITDGCLYTTCLSQYFTQRSNYMENFPNNAASGFTYAAEPPCCGPCTIAARNVDLFYWPTPAPTPAATELVDIYNYTYSSPSVYAYFFYLSATNACSTIGNYFYTFAGYKVRPEDLSTSSFVVNPKYLTDSAFSTYADAPGQWTAINFADFTDATCKCVPPDCEFDPILEIYLTDKCTPQLSIPTIISALNPLWQQCKQDFNGVFDPPIALPGVVGLTPPKTTPVPPPTIITTTAGPTPAPVVGATLTPPIPPATVPTITASSSTNAPLVPSSVEPPPLVGVLQPISSATPIPGGNSIPPFAEPLASPSIAPVVPVAISSTTSPRPLVTVGGVVLTPLPGSSVVFVVGSQSLFPGSVITLENGATISLTPAGTSIIVSPGAAVTSVLIPTSFAPAGNILTINGQTLTANPSSAFVIDGQTLAPGGPPVTVSGTVISLAPGGTAVIIGGSTSTRLGSIIASVFSGTAPASSTPAQYTGAADKGAVLDMLNVVIVEISVLIVLFL